LFNSSHTGLEWQFARSNLNFESLQTAREHLAIASRGGSSPAGLPRLKGTRREPAQQG
jgi:hypothetical protein